MPFGVVSGVDLGMGVVIVEGEGAVLGVKLGHPIVTNGAFATRSSQITLRTFYTHSNRPMKGEADPTGDHLGHFRCPSGHDDQWVRLPAY